MHDQPWADITRAEPTAPPPKREEGRCSWWPVIVATAVGALGGGLLDWAAYRPEIKRPLMPPFMGTFLFTQMGFFLGMVTAWFVAMSRDKP